ncbi:MAG: Asp-tRNA(Asn)/Glu-tRNA(Gln) amidotransferase subunit GatB [Ruminococcaceae bacterium]|nr:Asp-tRNA(Asn)/Glu-tRNA(Gln) amidotransferase subunit GatB [Oscillospiraceae bacterium]
MSWEIIMGIEVHVELSTKTKAFCSCTTQFGGDANTHCCPICTGMPGTLPVLNKKVLEYAIKSGLALNCSITQYNKFDRKNYFYPDLPKAYQISQLYLPFAQNGSIDITTKNGDKKTIRIHEIHMEEDAGKLTHIAEKGISYADYNRCGVPLLEIVSEPDFRSSDEVIAYLEKLKSTFEYLEISDCKMQEGSMRADVNLSVRKVGETEFGTRTEMKNIGSFKAIEKAIEYESKRQIEAIENGEEIIQETRRWDEALGKSISMRSKENAQDYRYFPEPDIPPIYISDEMINEIKSTLPEMAETKKEKYINHYGLSEYDANIITSNKTLAKLFEETNSYCNEPKEVANWILGQVLYLAGNKNLEYEEIKISPKVFADFVTVIAKGTVNRKTGRDIFEIVFDADETFDVNKYIADNNLAMVNDDGAAKEIVKQVIEQNPQSVEDFKAGKTRVVGFLIGQCMKALKGKGNPETLSKLVNEELSKL